MEKEKIEPRASIKIEDRGIKLNYHRMVEEVTRWKRISYFLIIAIIFSSTNFVYGLLGLKAKAYVQSTEGQLVELRELPAVPITQTRVASFVDEAVLATMALNVANVEEQLKRASRYYTDESYKTVTNELVRSNYIKNVKDNNLIISMIPTSDYFKAKVLAKKGTEMKVGVARSYLVTEYSGKKYEKKYVIVKTIVENSANYEKYPWGMYINSFVVDNYSETEFKYAVEKLHKGN